MVLPESDESPAEVDTDTGQYGVPMHAHTSTHTSHPSHSSAHAAPRASAHTAGQAYEDLSAYLSLPAADLVTQIHALRGAGHGGVADQLLSEKAVHGDPADVALVTVLLRLARRDTEADAVLGAVVARPDRGPAEVAWCLLRLGDSAECSRLLAVAASGPATEIALMARLLHGQGCEPQVAELLAAAAAFALARAALPALALSLIEAGLAVPARPALAAALRGQNEDRLLATAEELDAAGADVLAFPLYARSGGIIAGHWPADRVAALAHRMADAGQGECLDELVEAAADADSAFPSQTAYLATALAAAQQPQAARALLDRVAPRMGESELDVLCSYLHAGRQSALSVHALAAASASRPARATVAFMDTLRKREQPESARELLLAVLAAHPAKAAELLALFRAEGRAADADLLAEQVATAGPQLRGRVAAALWHAGAAQEADRLLGGLDLLALDDLVPVIAAFEQHAGTSGGMDPLTARLTDRSPHEFAEAIARMRRDGRDESADVLIGILGRAPAHTGYAAAVELARARLSRDAGMVLDRFAVQAAPQEVVEICFDLERIGGGGTAIVIAAAVTGRRDSATVLYALRYAGAADMLDRHLDELVRGLPLDRAAALCVSLFEQDAMAELDAMLTRCARRPDAGELRMLLHHEDRHALAYHLAERRAELNGPE